MNTRILDGTTYLSNGVKVSKKQYINAQVYKNQMKN
jgi:hypothetical protein